MGTPHRGSPYASYGKMLGDITNLTLHVSYIHRLTGGVRTTLIETLARENGELQAISEDFYSIVQESALHVISLYETEAHPLTNRTVCTVIGSRRAGMRSDLEKTDQGLKSRSLKSLQHTWGCVARNFYHFISVIRIFVDSPGRKMSIIARYLISSNPRLLKSRARTRQ